MEWDGRLGVGFGQTLGMSGDSPRADADQEQDHPSDDGYRLSLHGSPVTHRLCHEPIG